MANSAKKSPFFLYLGLGCLMILVIAGLFTPKDSYLPYTTQSPEPNGTKAILLLLNNEGFTASSLSDVTPPGKGLMIVVKPSGKFQESQWQQILNWVAEGNTLLLASDRSNAIYKNFKYELTTGSRLQGAHQFTSQHPLLKDVGELDLTGATRLRKDSSMRLALEDDQGVYFAEASQGKGQVLFLTQPSLLTNQEINKQDNLILFLNIVRHYGQDGIFFNEFVHGYTFEKSTRELFTWPLALVVTQLALGVLLLFYFWGKRFGRPIPLPKKTDQLSGGYVSSMANLYRQSRQRQLILESIYQGFRQDLTYYLGVSLQSPNKELVRLFSSFPQLDTTKLKNLLGHCAELLENSNLSETALFTIVQDIELWKSNNLTSSRKRRTNHD